MSDDGPMRSWSCNNAAETLQMALRCSGTGYYQLIATTNRRYWQVAYNWSPSGRHMGGWLQRHLRWKRKGVKVTWNFKTNTDLSSIPPPAVPQFPKRISARFHRRRFPSSRKGPQLDSTAGGSPVPEKDLSLILPPTVSETNFSWFYPTAHPFWRLIMLECYKIACKFSVRNYNTLTILLKR